MNTITLRPPSSSSARRVGVATAAMALLFGFFAIAGTQLGSGVSDQARPPGHQPPPAQRMHTL